MKQIENIRVAQKNDDNLVARKILSQSDPRSVLPSVHTAVVSDDSQITIQQAFFSG